MKSLLIIDLFIGFIANILKKNKFDTILVVPPKHDDVALFTPEDYDYLYDVVTAFSLMTYDYSNVHRPGPNAPLQWVKDCVTFVSPDENKRDKILTGLNFYGNDYTPSSGGPIVGNQYITLLKNYKGKLHFDSKSVENYFEVK